MEPDMPRRLITLTADEFYHVYNRGNNKEKIFFEEKNYVFFLERLAKYVQEAALIHAFCLLPNHYHLLIQVLNEEKFIKAFEGFSISYVKSVNKVYRRVGHLFQGRYRAKLVGSEE